MNHRCHFDLIDMQTNADGKYKFIFVSQGQSLCNLGQRIEKPLKRLETFCKFGALSILQSDKGVDFVNKVVENLTSTQLKIINSKPRHIQNQGRVEKAKQDLFEYAHDLGEVGKL